MPYLVAILFLFLLVWIRIIWRNSVRQDLIDERHKILCERHQLLLEPASPDRQVKWEKAERQFAETQAQYEKTKGLLW